MFQWFSLICRIKVRMLQWPVGLCIYWPSTLSLPSAFDTLCPLSISNTGFCFFSRCTFLPLLQDFFPCYFFLSYEHLLTPSSIQILFTFQISGELRLLCACTFHSSYSCLKWLLLGSNTFLFVLAAISSMKVESLSILNQSVLCISHRTQQKGTAQYICCTNNLAVI